MDNDYTEAFEKIEETLGETLPPVPDTSWYERVFPGVNLAALLSAAPPVLPPVQPLLEPGRDLLGRGGKRWRPLLSLAVCRALGGGDAALPLLPLVEFSHNASLIHDDLEDNSRERRGKPAVHLLYGEDTAINSGSFLYFLPLAVMETWDVPAEVRDRIWTCWARHMRRLHLGQSMDIAWHRDAPRIPSIDEYMLMCSLKTGCLARFAALLGAETAWAARTIPADPELSARLGEAAEKLGVGFQILDDVKNLGPGVPGKQRGDDLVEGKKSLPVLLFLQAPGAGPSEDRIAFTRRCFQAARQGGVSVPEVEEFIRALRDAGALEEAERRGRALIAEGGTVFAELPAEDPGARRLLKGFTGLIQ
ncbi:MAG: polyprenyl synthetase family protein [Treponema sp.]|jgi:octaprenyl-diphosphate synthase|nr:polyprenyl synthetase family protein [Treponema sp.]